MIALSVAFGGGIGALVRYVIAQKFSYLKLFGAPAAMIIANLIGSFGLASILFSYQASLTLLAFLGTGFFGGLTTFSTFSVEAVQLWNDGNKRGLLFYVLFTILGSMIMFYIGYLLTG
jgi:CrcB protein